MLGVGAALLTALCWAGSSTINKFLTTRIDILSINVLRLWVGSILLFSFIFLSGRWDDFISTPSQSFIFVIASGVIALAIGDTVYIKSLSLIDVSRAFPIGQGTFPILTMLVAFFLLDETFTWPNMLGAVLVILGIYLIAVVGKESSLRSAAGRVNIKGVALVLAAALTWTIGASTLKIGVANIDTFVAAAIRIPAAAIVLTVFVLSQNRGVALQFRTYGARNISLAAIGGILAYGIAAVTYVTAMQLIGAGKTVLLTISGPLFVLPLSLFILKERPTRYTIGGIIMTVAGIYLVTL